MTVVPAEAPAPEVPTSNIRFTAAVNDLRDALAWVAWALPGRRAAMPVLRGVRLAIHGGVLAVSAQDYEVQATAQVNTPGGTGTALVAGADLQRIINALPRGSGINVTAEASELVIVGGNEGGEICFRLPLMNLADYPSDLAQGDVLADMTGLSLAHLGRATVAAGRDDTLPVLTAVRLAASNRYGGLVAAATDRYRLAVATSKEIAWPGDASILIPAAVLQHAAKSLRKDPRVTVSSTIRDKATRQTVTFSTGYRTLTARLLEGEFPKWESLVPDEFPAGIDLERGVFLDALTAVEAVLYRNAPVHLNIHDGQPLVMTGDPKAESKASAKVPGATASGFPEPTRLALNPQYLRDGVKSLNGPNVAVDFTGPTRPVIIRQSDDPTFLYLVMPVRLSG